MANLGTIVVGNYEASYEHRLGKRFSISSSAIYYDSRAVLWRVFSYGYFIGLGFMPKLHIFGKAHANSFYLAPSWRFGFLHHPARDASESADKGLLSRFGAGFGFQHVFNGGLMLDLMVGLEHYHVFSLSRAATRYQDEGRILVRPYIGTMLGFAF